ncbi:hypothetical protein LOK49_LG05G02811 [Camellia lanceoleosa]|uniref:Uncharacterized protein n=1 Tax=Camellia lanceoleosa TaxID=1840588 RepID=A0ACC0HKX9_9ERIC|nr:hypothetical protein LOK49_LG05G02811 [Camellia lanceoleosa]
MVEGTLGISKALEMLMIIKRVMVGILLGTRMMAIGWDGFIRVCVRLGVGWLRVQGKMMSVVYSYGLLELAGKSSRNDVHQCENEDYANSYQPNNRGANGYKHNSVATDGYGKYNRGLDVEGALGISKALEMLMIIKGVMVGILLVTRMMAIGRDGFVRVCMRLGMGWLRVRGKMMSVVYSHGLLELAGRIARSHGVVWWLFGAFTVGGFQVISK